MTLRLATIVHLKRDFSRILTVPAMYGQNGEKKLRFPCCSTSVIWGDFSTCQLQIGQFYFQSCIGTNLSNFFTTQINKSGPAKFTPPGSCETHRVSGPSQTYRIRICILKRSPVDLYSYLSLRNSGLRA